MSESIISERQVSFLTPHCGQMIYSDVVKHLFCSSRVDRQAAVRGADLQQHVNSACNQAKMLRISAGVMWVFFLLGLIPFSQLGWGFTGLFFVIPVSLIYWQIKFGGLQSSDADYKRAQRDRLIALFIWLPALALELFSIGVGLLVS